MIGAIMRQGPHQGAQASTSTGMPWFVTRLKSASVILTGMLLACAGPIDSGALHRPQTGCIWFARSSIRFFAPQLGQVTVITTLRVAQPPSAVRGTEHSRGRLCYM